MDGDDNRLRALLTKNALAGGDCPRSKLSCSLSCKYPIDEKYASTQSLLQASTTESMSSAPSVDTSDNYPWKVRRDGNFLDSKSFSISKSSSEITTKDLKGDENVNHRAEDNSSCESSIDKDSSFDHKLQELDTRPSQNAIIDVHRGPSAKFGDMKKDFEVDVQSVRSYASFVPTQLYPAAAAATLSESFETASSRPTSSEKERLQLNEIINAFSDDEENIKQDGNSGDQEVATYWKNRSKDSKSIRCGKLNLHTKGSVLIPFLEIEDSLQHNVSRMTLSKSASESDDDTEFKRMETVTHTYQRHDSDAKRKDSTFSAVPLSGIGVDLKNIYNHGDESIPTPKEAAKASCSVAFFVKDIFDAISPQNTTPKKKSTKKKTLLSPLDFVVSESFPIATTTECFFVVQFCLM